MPLAADLYYHAHEGSSPAAPPVILIHGAGGSHLHWPAEIRRLPGQRVYALDLPGHGKSEGRGQQSINAYAHLVIEWMNALETARAFFIGHSMGSAISMVIALQYPEQVIGLSLIGSGPRLPVDPAILSFCNNPTTYHKAVDALTTRAFSPSADPRLVELASKRTLETRLSVLKGDLLACSTFEVGDQLENIRQPTRVISGADDRLTPVRSAEQLASRIPNSRLEIIPQAGHMVMLEKPLETAEILNRFLSSFTAS
jgi:pimeloyl-ACP methyl ester carboxylesterase